VLRQRRGGDPTSRGERAVRIVVVVKRDADLAEVVDALSAARGFARGLNCRQEQRDQNADDRDHDEQLNECEAGASARSSRQVPAHGLWSFPWPCSSALRKGTGARLARNHVPPGMLKGRSIAWVAQRAVFWLASLAVLRRLPTSDGPQWRVS